ncbi:hypothetical protein TSUD_60420 [Trifolium subterraneum]|uniref:Uncharacterized protein n=1 Tax=Trifolium subterraneum TaxID=3900 RepID=A0A2Z6NUS0_TRISU|nr:hypothetical protein TSUD_60420 [Trifolium subterraneum]
MNFNILPKKSDDVELCDVMLHQVNLNHIGYNRCEAGGFHRILHEWNYLLMYNNMQESDLVQLLRHAVMHLSRPIKI